MRAPQFTIDDVKYADGPATFGRAQDLFRSGKVQDITETVRGYRAIVQGTHPYDVGLSYRRVDEGDCSCYLGQNGRLCKHVLSLALAVLHATARITPPPQQPPAGPEEIKPLVNAGMRKLRYYTGPSRTWFSYQRSLAAGAGMIVDAVGLLPPTKENARYLWQLIERIDKKLANGVDDSDGVVGTCVMALIEQLAAYANRQPDLEPIISRFCDKETNFDFGHELRAKLG
jgi:hypothetical protein